MNKTNLTIIIPVKNEGINIFKIYQSIMTESKKRNIPCIIIYIDDYSDSNDNATKKYYLRLKDKKNVFILNNRGKKGQYNATFFGLKESTTPYIGIIDCDMQDPINILFDMYIQLKNDIKADTCLGVRKSRKDSPFKIFTANIYYKIMSIILNRPIYNTSSFYVMKKECIPYFDVKYPTGSLQTRTACTTYLYNRINRKNGKTKYNIFKLCKLGFKGVFWAIKERLSLFKEENIQRNMIDLR